MSSPTCFLIDDDPDDREIFCIAMKSADDSCACVTAKNGIEALEKLTADENFVPDYIFVDLNMPYMSGKECLMQIKNVPRLKRTPVIIYTTSSYSKDIEETKKLGASHFIVKPSSVTDLVNILSNILRKEGLPYCLDN